MRRSFMQSYIRIACLIALAFLLLFLDFFSKAYIYHVLPFFEMCANTLCTSIPVFHNVLGVDFWITPAINKGAAWGMFANFQMVLLGVRFLVILGIFIYLFFLNQNRKIDVPLVLICTGAIGNVIDFFLYGFVVDFLHFNLWGYHFPIFNVADSCITIGVVWLLINSFIKKQDARVQEDPTAPSL